VAGTANASNATEATIKDECFMNRSSVSLFSLFVLEEERSIQQGPADLVPLLAILA
jgi:hypothetical protein